MATVINCLPSNPHTPPASHAMPSDATAIKDQAEASHNVVKLFPTAHIVSQKTYSTSADPRGFMKVYEYQINSLPIMIDCQTGYVHFTNIWRLLGHAKADVTRLIESDPSIASSVKKLKGGLLVLQGFWIPYEIALALAKRVAYTIRFDLVPLFGPAFPSLCTLPGEPGYGQLLLSEPKKKIHRNRASSNSFQFGLKRIKSTSDLHHTKSASLGPIRTDRSFSLTGAPTYTPYNFPKNRKNATSIAHINDALFSSHSRSNNSSSSVSSDRGQSHSRTLSMPPVQLPSLNYFPPTPYIHAQASDTPVTAIPKTNTPDEAAALTPFPLSAPVYASSRQALFSPVQPSYFELDIFSNAQPSLPVVPDEWPLPAIDFSNLFTQQYSPALPAPVAVRSSKQNIQMMELDVADCFRLTPMHSPMEAVHERTPRSLSLAIST